MSRIAISVAGASCSGKTTLAEALRGSYGATLLRIDDYYRPLDHLSYEQRCHVNFDHPDAIDHELLTHHVRSLIGGTPVEVPCYDFTRHTRSMEVQRIDPCSHLVIEGLFAMTYPELLSLCKVRIFVEASSNVCLDRRIARDVHERGRTPDEVVGRFRNHAWPMYVEHILPNKRHATDIVNGETDFLQALPSLAIAHA